MTFPFSDAAHPSQRLYPETTSTFDAAFALKDELPVWHSVLAAVQTGGRGQLGRHWISPPGNLYASLRLPAASPFTGPEAAPAVSAFLAEGLRTLGLEVKVKWPNDLVLAAASGLRKVGGILVEERGGIILAGVGLNVASAPADALLRAQASLPAGTLPTDALEAAGVASLADLWARLSASMQRLCEADPACWRGLLTSRLAFLGEMVCVDDGELVHGRLMGVDSHGGLRLHTPQGDRILYSGSLAGPSRG